ncbi:MAG: biotin--[acetyl-CoA-carboxylase] ligase [Desulfovibrio sp.]|jgi:BirA family biotin operon repressor/biotin-[acetyl-CoA-carboxylase] ligase|nr:biotin--[acetyl-CoA-carboxylase] ligase [Desulfovibrio sp.]
MSSCQCFDECRIIPWVDSPDVNNNPLPVIWFTGQATSALDAGFWLQKRDRLAVWDSVIVAAQTAGRGQLRRTWFSPPGNIYAALRLPLIPPFDGSAASVATGLLLASALHELGWPVLLKWPNDLVLLSRQEGIPHKLGGILLEERGGVLLAGIGINVASAPSICVLRKNAAMAAASLADFVKQPLLAEKLWQQLVKHVYLAYAQDSAFIRRWQSRAEQLLLWRGSNVELSEDRHTTRGKLAGLSPTGGICLFTDGKMTEFLSGTLRRA